VLFSRELAQARFQGFGATVFLDSWTKPYR
jgi:hypothetical protein